MPGVIEEWELQQLRLLKDRTIAIRRLADILVRRKGNLSEAAGLPYQMFPAWALDEAKAMIEAKPASEAYLPPTNYQRQLIEAMVYKVFRRNADKAEIQIARDIVQDAEPAAEELGGGVTGAQIREFMYDHYPQLRPKGGNPGNPGRQTRQQTLGGTPSVGPQPVQFYGMVMMFTNGFRSLSSDMQAKIMDHAMKQIHPYDEEKRTGGPDMIFYDPSFPGPQRFEDQGRSMHVPVPGLSEKAYAKLDDYGSAEALSESMGQRTGARYTCTFLLASEY